MPWFLTFGCHAPQHRESGWGPRPTPSAPEQVSDLMADERKVFPRDWLEPRRVDPADGGEPGPCDVTSGQRDEAPAAADPEAKGPRAGGRRAAATIRRGGGTLARRAGRAATAFARDERAVAAAKRGVKFAALGVAAVAAQRQAAQHTADRRLAASFDEALYNPPSDARPETWGRPTPQTAATPRAGSWLEALTDTGKRTGSSGVASTAVPGHEDEAWQVLPPSPGALQSMIASRISAANSIRFKA